LGQSCLYSQSVFCIAASNDATGNPYGVMGDWDVSAVTDMSSVFNGASAFNQDLSNWNTRAVTSMSYMFSGSAFNQDLSNWDVSAVTDMGGVFSGAKAFNQDLSNWNTTAVRGMYSMFKGASAFNQDVSTWDTGAVTNGCEGLVVLGCNITDNFNYNPAATDDDGSCGCEGLKTTYNGASCSGACGEKSADCEAYKTLYDQQCGCNSEVG